MKEQRSRVDCLEGGRPDALLVAMSTAERVRSSRHDLPRFGIGDEPTPLDPFTANLRPLRAWWTRVLSP